MQEPLPQIFRVETGFPKSVILYSGYHIDGGIPARYISAMAGAIMGDASGFTSKKYRIVNGFHQYLPHLSRTGTGI